MSSKKILIVGPSWVGDMVMAQTLFKILKQNDADVTIDVLAPAWTKPLLARMPEVRQAIDLPFAHGELRLRDRYRLARSLRSQRYDQAIVLPNSFKSALIPWWARIPRRTGWVGEMRYGVLNDARRLDEKKFPLMIQQFMALGIEKNATLPADLPWPRLAISEDSVATVLQVLQVERPVAPLLVLCPGAEFGAAKQWPAEYYAEIAKKKLNEGWVVWLLGSAKDKVVADQIQALTDHRTRNFAGVTTLTQAVDLLSLATLVVANDSGLMHVAGALARRLIVVYGSTTPHFTPPLSKEMQALKLELSCSPCFERQCPLKHFKCMRDLTPALVLDAMQNLVAVDQTQTQRL